MTIEYRIDPTKGQIVVVANERSKRPLVFGKTKVTCPFDKGVEKITPPTKLAYPSEKAWKTRVFDNAFAFLKPRGKYKHRIGREWTSPAYGEHEVIVESDEHSALLQDLPAEQLARVFKTYQKRFTDLEAKKGVKCVFLFKNHGLKGGASIEHEHSQITTLPFIPPVIAAELDANERAGKCLHCEMLVKQKKNVLAQNKHFTAVCPPFARFPFETWIISKEHINALNQFSEEQGAAYMELLTQVIKRVFTVTKDYNIAYHNAPTGTGLHFHAEIYPRPNTWAGFELGTGVVVNSKSEVDALTALKSALV